MSTNNSPMALREFVRINHQTPWPVPRLQRAIEESVYWAVRNMPSPLDVHVNPGLTPPVTVDFRHEAGLLLVSVRMAPGLSETARAMREMIHHKYAILGAIAHTATSHRWHPLFLLHGSPQLGMAILAPNPPPGDGA